MKKFISMVMAAAMVVSLVPATAFAGEATFKVVNDQEYTVEVAEDMKDDATVIEGPELQIKVVDVDSLWSTADTYEFTLDFENAEIAGPEDTVVFAEGDTIPAVVGGAVTDLVVVDEVEAEDTSITLELTETSMLKEKDIIAIDLADLGLALTSDKAGTECTVEVSGDFGDSDAMVFAAVLKEGVKVTLKKVAEVAEEDETTLEKDLKIEAVVGTFCADQVFELTVSKGFEIAALADGAGYEVVEIDENEAVIVLTGSTDEVVIAAADMTIEAVDAKEGDVCTITVRAKGEVEIDDVDYGCDDCIKATAEAVDAVKVIGESVTMSVDEDEDVPVMYSGVNVDEDGLTSGEDHTSLEVTIEESVAEAWDLKKGFTLSLTDGVYVVGAEGVTFTAEENIEATAKGGNNLVDVFEAAYEDGDYKMFDFGRRVMDRLNDEDTIELSFTLELVADAGFVGDVVLTLDLEGETQEVVIATFVTPMIVEAAQNDVIIDYRNTEVPTNIVVKETEAGLWDKGLTVGFYVDEPVSSIVFEDTADVAVDEASEMEIEDWANSGSMGFSVDAKSDEEGAVVTISEIELYMSRSVPAGAYDLGMFYEYRGVNGYLDSVLFGASEDYEIVDDVTDMDGIVKEGWINVITAGRDQDDASFTKKVVVTIGANEIVAGEDVVALDVPAYINANGYTMLPVRAVAVALGINTNNVLWDQTTKTVTILYGQRIITMTVGQKVVNVNGSAIPATAAVEVVDGRAFLGMRDLATALGVTDITWNAETQQATLNGNK
ncbi:MAG: copper amine oxidase N-terminal domain-containing protein [Anaerotignum sp.]|nr:copper amine oxidase N-terminal domain-containing protein [Anaerotignum sp.]